MRIVVLIPPVLIRATSATWCTVVPNLPEAQTDLYAADTWLTTMTNVAAKHGISKQFGGCVSSMFLHSVTLPSVKSARVGPDYIPSASRAPGTCATPPADESSTGEPEVNRHAQVHSQSAEGSATLGRNSLVSQANEQLRSQSVARILHRRHSHWLLRFLGAAFDSARVPRLPSPAFSRRSPGHWVFGRTRMQPLQVHNTGARLLACSATARLTQCQSGGVYRIHIRSSEWSSVRWLRGRLLHVVSMCSLHV